MYESREAFFEQLAAERADERRRLEDSRRWLEEYGRRLRAEEVRRIEEREARRSPAERDAITLALWFGRIWPSSWGHYLECDVMEDFHARIGRGAAAAS